MSKFKVGDRVAYNNIDEWGVKPQGALGTVICIDGYGHKVKWDEKQDHENGCHSEEYLEMANSHGVDAVNSPSHYMGSNGIECIAAIRAALTEEEFRGYCKGNAMKYIWRERGKGGDESLKKGIRNIEFITETNDAS